MNKYQATRARKALAELSNDFTRDEIGALVGASRTWVTDTINGHSSRYRSINAERVERAEFAVANKEDSSNRIQNYSDAWKNWFIHTAKRYPEIVKMSGLGDDRILRLKSAIPIRNMIALSRWMPLSSPQLQSFGLFDVETKRGFSDMDCVGLDELDREIHATSIWGEDNGLQEPPPVHSGAKIKNATTTHRPLNGVRLDAEQANTWRAEVNRMYEAGAVTPEEYRAAMTSIAVAQIGVDWTPFG